MEYIEVLQKIPFDPPFLFVDELTHIDEMGAEGHFTFISDMDFYKGHFKKNPVTPGVILTECCAQIGLVCLGIFLLNKEHPSIKNNLKIALSSSEMEFLTPVFPNEKVTVRSEKHYFRFGKLKCAVKMYNAKGELVCKGNLAGMLKTE